MWPNRRWFSYRKGQKMVRVKLTGVLIASAMAIAFTVGSAFPAAAGGSYTCRGGTPHNPSVIHAGTYGSITVAGFCLPAPGVLTVQKSLTVAPGGTFFSLFAGATVTIDGSVDVQSGGLFALGCAPSFDVSCFDDPSGTSHDTIRGNLSAERALLLIVHNDTIDGNVGVQGGGGGLACQNIRGLHTPAYVDFSTNVIGRNASVEGLRTCWDGFSDNTIGGNVSLVDNHTLIEDGNFVGGNTIARNLSCFRDDPRPHLSDFAPVPNSVTGHTEGQCVDEV
jgi:hypothetical protein